MKYLIDKDNLKFMISILFSVTLSFLLIKINTILAFIFISISLTLITYQYIKKRDVKVSEMVQFLKRLNQGHYDYDISSYQEGELSKLQTELNKTTITLKQMNMHLSQQKDLLQKGLEDVSHQLKTPLASLILLNELQDEDELVIKSKEQLERLKYLVESLLRLIKLDAGIEVFEIESFKLDALMEDVISLVNPMLKDIVLDIDVANIECMGDYNRSKEAILNVVYNKLRHADTKISIKSKKEHLSSILLISDDGDPVLNKNRIFERFYTGDKRDVKSIGIGLAIAKEIMNKQGGALTLEGDNTFVFRFDML